MKLLFSTALAICLCAVGLIAQQPVGTITGVVADTAGAPIQGARLTVRSESTGVVRQTTSSQSGTYSFPLLAPGSYEISAEAGGFYRVSRKGIVLNTNVTLTINLDLPAGQVNETIIVQAEAGQVDTSTGTLRQILDQRRITELPIVDRNPTRLVLLAAGTADHSNPAVSKGGGEQARVAGQTAASQVSYPGTLVLSSAGGRTDSIDFILDGGSNRDIYLNVNGPLPNPDALHELVVQMNNVSAEYRSAVGGVVMATTKSGSNSLNGSAFEFLRNDALNATPFFNNAHGGGKDKLKRNQFGATLGGPIIKDRVFAFGSYQGLRIRKAATRTRFVVFSDSQRAGMFGGTTVPINAVSAALLEYIPRADNPATGELFVNKRQDEHEDQYLFRLDVAGLRNRFFGRFFDARYSREMIPGIMGNLYVGMPGYRFNDFSMTAGLSTILSAAAINNLTIAVTGLQTLVYGASPIGMNDLNPKVAGIREINMAFGGGLSNINFLGRDRDIRRQSWQFIDGAHFVGGKQDLAIGGEMSHSTLHHASVYRQAGFYTFASPRDFIAGNLTRLVQGGGEHTDKTYWNSSLYAHYTLRASKRLSLSVGLRWDPFDPPKDSNRKAMCFVSGSKSARFPNAPSGILFAGESGCPDAGFNKVWTDFAPRFGFAYDLSGNATTVIRGGAGLAYQPPYLQALGNLVAIPPFSPQILLVNTRFDDPYGFAGVPNPFPQKFGPRAGSADDTFTLPAVVTSYQSDWKPPRAWNYNLTIEHRLANALVVRAAYVGASGDRLGFNTDVNFPKTTADLAKGVRPNPDFGKMTQNQSLGASAYNALQLGVARKSSHGIAFDAHYTWSKSLDDVSSISDLDKLNLFNPLDPYGYWAVSDFDVNHRFVSNVVWEIPGPALGGFVGALVQGWQASVIASAQSGAPFSVVSNNNVSDVYDVGGGQVLATATGRPSLTTGSKAQRIDSWFVTSAFSQTPDNSFGSSPRNVLRGPGQFTLDVALSKTFRIREGLGFQYRVEFFNALNRANFCLPNNNAGRPGVPNPDFGKITGTLDPRIIQMAVKFTF